jgi:hypothetical protein
MSVRFASFALPLSQLNGQIGRLIEKTDWFIRVPTDLLFFQTNIEFKWWTGFGPDLLNIMIFAIPVGSSFEGGFDFWIPASIRWIEKQELFSIAF